MNTRSIDESANGMSVIIPLAKHPDRTPSLAAPTATWLGSSPNTCTSSGTSLRSTPVPHPTSSTLAQRSSPAVYATLPANPASYRDSFESGVFVPETLVISAAIPR